MAEKPVRGKTAERPKIWRVVGGTASGGLLVREGAKTSSAERSERLATGSVVVELESAGDRLRYQRLRGTGPDSGWISTNFKGKELLERHQFKVWLMCGGSRGDFQPYLALALGLQRAGFDVSLWSHEDFRAHAEHYGLRYFAINPASEAVNRNMCGATGCPGNAQVESARKLQTFWARWQLSHLAKARVHDVWFLDDVPEEIVSESPALAECLVGPAARELTLAGDASAEQLEQVYSKLKAVPAAPSKAESPESPPSAAAIAVAEEIGFQPGSWEYGVATAMYDLDWTDDFQMFRFGETVSRVGRFSKEPRYTDVLMSELQSAPPDLVLCNLVMAVLGFQLEQRCGAPVLLLSLQPSGVDLSDPTAKWVPKAGWPMFLSLNPGMKDFSGLEEAREARLAAKKPEPECLASWSLFLLWVSLEACCLKPLLGTSAVRDMGLEALHKKVNEGTVVGFLTAVTGDRFLDWLGEDSKRNVRKHIYTGFWMLPDQESGPAAAFGGEELLQGITRFLEAGPKPVYIGFGSCFSEVRGRYWMVVLSVYALKLAGMRGIVLGGWTGLSYELLEDIVGADDALGLCAYAREHVLFVPKAPQAWLFPQCAALVIHGGVGTLGAAWLSGVPTIVLPVWMDQPANGMLHQLLTAAPFATLLSVDLVDVSHLAHAMKAVTESQEAQQAARFMRFSMMRDKGVQNVVETIDKVLMPGVAR